MFIDQLVSPWTEQTYSFSKKGTQTGLQLVTNVFSIKYGMFARQFRAAGLYYWYRRASGQGDIPRHQLGPEPQVQTMAGCRVTDKVTGVKLDRKEASINIVKAIFLKTFPQFFGFRYFYC